MTATLKEMFFRTLAVIMTILMEVCCGSDSPKSYGPSASPYDGYQNSYDPEFQRPLAVFTEKPVNVAGFVLIPVVQVPSSDLRMIYRPQIDSVSKTEPIVMCKSSTKSVEATPAVQVPLQQPFYLYDERTMIPFPKTVTILHGGYRVSIPVGVVVAPIPASALRTGPLLVTTLFAIPAGPLPAPTQAPVKYAPWSSYPPSPAPYMVAPSPQQYSATPLSSSPQYSAPAATIYSPSSSQHSATHSSQSAQYSTSADHSSPPQYSGPAVHPSSQYSGSVSQYPPSQYSGSVSQYPSSQYSGPAVHPSSQYSGANAHPSSQYSAGPVTRPSYSGTAARPPSSPQYSSAPYSQPVPPAPTYYQHSDYSEDGDNDLRYRDPPGQLYSHYTASSPFYNSKESPVLHQLREESEKNRQKYASQPPPYSHHYQTVDA